MPWTIYSRREATSRAARALIEDPSRSDAALAIASGTSTTTIGSVRARLEAVGVIPRVPPSDRTARPRPPQPPSPTQLAIAAGCTTPRAIADHAQVSMQAAWKAWRKANPPLHDAAAATDQLTVSKMPRQLADAAAAADRLTVVKPPPAVRRPAQPYIPQLPEPPDWQRGLCTTSPSYMRSWWTSSDRDEREAAARACASCPILEPCEQWSLSLSSEDTSIYAGMTQAERIRRKRALRDEFTAKTLRGWRR